MRSQRLAWHTSCESGSKISREYHSILCTLAFGIRGSYMEGLNTTLSEVSGETDYMKIPVFFGAAGLAGLVARRLAVLVRFDLGAAAAQVLPQ